MVVQNRGVWCPAGTKKPTGVGFAVGGDLTNVPLLELKAVDALGYIVGWPMARALRVEYADGCHRIGRQGRIDLAQVGPPARSCHAYEYGSFTPG